MPQKSRTLQFRTEEGFTLEQIRAAILALDGEDVPRRTLADLPRLNLVTPSVRASGGRKGPLYPSLWSFDDFIRIRTIVKLRRQAGLSMPRVRALIQEFGPELFDALKPNSPTVLVVNRQLGVVLRDVRGDREIALPSGQFRLPLASMYADAAKALKILRAA